MAARAPGARRKKLAAYLRAANEIRQTYQQNMTRSWNEEDNLGEDPLLPGAYPDVAANKSANREELILFPSYSCWHPKKRSQSEAKNPGVTGSGRDEHDAIGLDDAEFWKQEWENLESDNAIVDVDVRGWLYDPQSGPLTRKQRLFIGLARQVTGIPAPPTDQAQSQDQDREASQTGRAAPAHAGPLQSVHDQSRIEREAEAIARRGEWEAAVADRGGYSELPVSDTKGVQPHETRILRESDLGLKVQQAYSGIAKDPQHEYNNTTLATRATNAVRTDPADMSPNELRAANRLLMTRIGPFLADPRVGSVLSVFFYNDTVSRMKTVETDAYGHFAMRASLDFVPTNVRVLASEKVSLTNEVKVCETYGISVISDIDDTIKHSAISSGAREIFRNVFIRNLEDLQVDGVREWFTDLANLGLDFHYVSNSPWQLFPVLAGFFSRGRLPPGSFHLKQYSGMLSGIFEPVAERKRSTLEKILKDFPERRFLLIGDSGEADLEVYTDVVTANPDRILGVFIRDVTTSGWNQPPNSERRPFGQKKYNQNHLGTTSKAGTSQGAFGDTYMVKKQTPEPASERPPPLPARPSPLLTSEEEEDLIDLDPVKTAMETNKVIALHSDIPSHIPQRPPKPLMLKGRPISRRTQDPLPTSPQSPQIEEQISNSIRPIPQSVSRSSYGNAARSSTTLTSQLDTPTLRTIHSPVSRKEELWWARWASAKTILDKHGVTLLSWQTGNDCRSASISIVEQYLRSRSQEP